MHVPHPSVYVGCPSTWCRALSGASLKSPEAKSGQAFTSVELLVVIAVLGLLALMVLPMVAGTADRSQRARCQNNLRQLAVGVTAQAGDNNGNLLPARSGGGSTWVQITLASLTPDVAMKVGLSSNAPSIWTCPNRPGLPEYASGFAQWNIGYQYFGGITTWLNPVGSFASRSPTNLATAQPHWALAADAIIRINGSWSGGGGRIPAIYSNLPPHHAENSLIPQGGNHAYVDGSVDWVQAERMIFLSSWDPGRNCYWYQDPKDFPVALSNSLGLLGFQP